MPNHWLEIALWLETGHIIALLQSGSDVMDSCPVVKAIAEALE